MYTPEYLPQITALPSDFIAPTSDPPRTCPGMIDVTPLVKEDATAAVEPPFPELPQATMLPSSFRATTAWLFPLMSMTPEVNCADTSVGVSRDPPSPLRPHATTLPSVFKAWKACACAKMSITSEETWLTTETVCPPVTVVMVPPQSELPHDKALPSSLSTPKA